MNRRPWLRPTALQTIPFRLAWIAIGAVSLRQAPTSTPA